MILFLSLVSLLSVAAAIWFYSRFRHAHDLNAGMETNSQLLQQQERDSREQNIRLVAENENLKILVERERRSAEELQIELKKQLELLGKNMVNEGSRILKTENEQQLNQLLTPLKERLEAFEKEVRTNNKQDIERFSSMESLVKTLNEQHSKMHSTAQNLVDALRGEQKTQGDWGEMALERILESSGLEKGREYFIQSSYRNTENELLRPDVVIHLPDKKHIVIDSKVSLKSFERFINEDDPAIKKEALAGHLLSIKTHIKQLGDKDYSHIEAFDSPDFVLMFIPLESSFALAVKEEPTLYQQAWEKRVVLVTPSTLLATLKTVESLWKQERQSRNALLIAEQAGRLYDKFVGFVNDLEKIGAKQADAQKAYDEALSKLRDGRGNLINSAQKLKELGVKSRHKIDDKLLSSDTEEGTD